MATRAPDSREVDLGGADGVVRAQPPVEPCQRLLESLTEEERLALDDDPVWKSMMNAPLDDEPETEEERQALEDFRAGRMEFVDSATVTAMIAERAATEG